MKSLFKTTNLFSHEIEETKAVDLRISGNWIIAFLLIASIIAMLLALGMPDSPQYANLENLSLIIFFLVVVTVLLYIWRPNFGIMFMIIGLVTCILLASYWLHLPQFLFLLACPVLFVGVCYSLRAAMGFACVESILLVYLIMVNLLADVNLLIITLVLIWSVYCLLLAIYLPVYQAVSWYRDNFNQIQIELKQLRGERENRVQLIEDLDNANRQMIALFDKTTVLRQIAEDAEKSKAIFVAKVSHEFRTPLSMIIGLSDLMIKDQDIYGTTLPIEVVEDMTVINRNCEHLAKLVDDVLDLTRAEAGQLTVFRDWTDISLEIEDAVSEIYPLLKKKKLEFMLEASDNLPRVFCDRMRIRQVVLNLVGNAVRYTEFGSIRVKISADELYITFEIADTGPGIPADDLELIFEPFARGHNHPRSENSGSGLGLSICRQFVELHGGKIWVTSILGQGSVFSFKILIYPQETPLSSPARWISQEKIWNDRKPRMTVDSTPTRERIMIYDPNVEFLQRLQHRTDGIVFEHARNLEEVVEQSKHNPVAAVLVNVDTPEMALQLVDKCRTQISDTLVVGCVFPSYHEKLLELRVASFLAKPINLEELELTIHSLPCRIQRILVVDDDIDLCNLLVRMLLNIDANFQVLTAYSGEEALQMMHHIKPDLVLLDVLLGGMNGWDVLKARNVSAEMRDIPIIILSGEDLFFDQLATPIIISAFGEGLSIDKLLQSTLDFSALMFRTG